MAPGRGRGHPRKTLKPPTYDDYPMDGTKAEQNLWVRCQSAEQWRYNKLMSMSAQSYREAENLHASKFCYEKKGQGKKTAAVGKLQKHLKKNKMSAMQLRWRKPRRKMQLWKKAD